ncbi:MAG: universal stress protein [Chloroflexi bacterium]|nr:universal stress protein [Chloroflexota bacterium]
MIEHMLVPLDGSSLAECVLPHVVALGKVFSPRISLVRVVEPVESISTTRAIDLLDWQMLRTEAEAYLDGVTGQLAEVGIKADRVVLEGQPAKRIVDFVREQGVDLVILSSHGRSGLSEWGISSVVQKVVLRALVPIFVVRAYGSEHETLEGLTYRRLLVPLDGSQRAECALAPAITLSEAYNADLYVTHIVARPVVPRRVPLTLEEQGLINRLTELNEQEARVYLRDVMARCRPCTETILRVADSASCELHRIIDERDVDLVVLSAHGHTVERSWPYGSVALNLIFYGATALLIIQDLTPGEIEPSEAELASKERKGH